MARFHRRQILAGLGALLAAPSVSRAGTSHYEYDAFGRVVGVIQSNGAAEFYSYDSAGNRTSKGNAGNITSDGFDPTFYKVFYPDIYNAGVDAYTHYNSTGWHERRRASAYFDTAWYLSTYTDVANAGVNPLSHYNTNGWHEGRDPSPYFSTHLYLQNYPDIAAANINPYVHFIQNGIYEGRRPYGLQAYAL
jgi:YD repeat-containing protein